MYMPNANKVALIIGMDMYDSEQLPALECCKKDATDLSYLVSKELGYFIFGGDAIIGSELERQIGWARMRQAIGDFFSDAKPNQLLLFYFSGHGILRGDDVYLATREVDTQKPWVTGFALSDCGSA
jgi:DNA segregation ATPase FtsK/SpoIIIE, S-DNA-T family